MSKQNKERLSVINKIIEEYQKDNYILTLRQLYYQLVSRDIIPNKQNEYTKLSTLLKEGRMAGIVDWDAIEDRLRTPYTPASFKDPEEILNAAISQYQLPRMQGQDVYLEVWVEKDALSGVLKRVTKKYHVPILVNRGYSSASAMHDSFQRFVDAYLNNQKIVILYLGDYDPSGIDMIRDIRTRVTEFINGYLEHMQFYTSFDFEVKPIALTREQINAYNPPPNPAKTTDPRAKVFIEKNGYTSWEVDALKPEVLNDLLESSIMQYIDINLYQVIVAKEVSDKSRLKKLTRYL